MTRVRSLAAAFATLAVLAASAASAATAPPAPCGAATLQAVEGVAGAVELSIYHGELLGNEVIADIAHVTKSAALVRAVASDNYAAATNAVVGIVYNRWHIVRLRVLDTAGHVLGDVGGPAVIAPVTGPLELNGRVVGSYVMSVQDDLGFAKLELHSVGDPIAIYFRGKLVTELGAHLPTPPPSGPTLTIGSVTYGVLAETFNAFPTGTLTAVTLVPPPAASLAAQPCIAVRRMVSSELSCIW